MVLVQIFCNYTNFLSDRLINNWGMFLSPILILIKFPFFSHILRGYFIRSFMFRIIIPPSSLWSDSISSNTIGLFLCKWYVLYCFLLLLKSFRDYLSGPVAKNPPFKAADMVQSLVRKIRSHLLQGNDVL